jgi:hypothetical protein
LKAKTEIDDLKKTIKKKQSVTIWIFVDGKRWLFGKEKKEGEVDVGCGVQEIDFLSTCSTSVRIIENSLWLRDQHKSCS